MAAGMAIMGFGGGAMIGTPMKEYFIRLFYRAPEYLGTQSQVELATEAGRRFAEVGGVLREVVIVGATEARDMTCPAPKGFMLSAAAPLRRRSFHSDWPDLSGCHADCRILLPLTPSGMAA